MFEDNDYENKDYGKELLEGEKEIRDTLWKVLFPHGNVYKVAHLDSIEGRREQLDFLENVEDLIRFYKHETMNAMWKIYKRG